jgi:hypothetical protein
VAASQCPRGHLASLGSVDQAIEAARRRLVDGRTVETQGGRRRLNRSNVLVNAVVGLWSYGDGETVAGTLALRREAEARCGARIAARSWAISLEYTVSLLAGDNESLVFLVHTRAGWRHF